MTRDGAAPRQLKIKKYSNRRFYDATRSCHVTLGELHDLIRGGYEVTVTDSKTGDDITHLVLTQILLERDAPKLNIFPANILHDVIRTQQEMLGNVVERFFHQALDAHRASQERWTSFVRNVFGSAASPGPQASPFDWTRAMMEAFSGKPASSTASDPDERELSDLRRQVAELIRKVDALSEGKRSRE